MDPKEIIANSREKLKSSGQSQTIEEVFSKNLKMLLEGKPATIPSSEITPIKELPHVDELGEFHEEGISQLSRTLVIKLNGGLGTSMGLERAKSLIQVKNGLSFLEIILKQNLKLRERYETEVPLLFMNSFRTESDTIAVLPKNLNSESNFNPSLLQHQVPKLSAETYLPVNWEKNPELEWCPPGHGDLYTVLVASGLLETALAKGYRYLFVSNSDNLGATLSLNILGYIAKNSAPFLMEVASRTAVDRKGGHLARSPNNRLLLREKAQVNHEDEEDFQNYERYKYFNTNSLWMNLEALKAQLDTSGGYLPLPLIQNRKLVDPNNLESPAVIQLETAMGSAIELFQGAEAVCVSRSRFLPVKTTEDLLRLQSDLFSLDENGELTGDPESLAFPVSLDKRYYKTVEMYSARFPHGPPSFTHCSSFTVKGDFTFGKSTSCEGSVLLESNDENPIYIEDDRQLIGKVSL